MYQMSNVIKIYINLNSLKFDIKMNSLTLVIRKAKIQKNKNLIENKNESTFAIQIK